MDHSHIVQLESYRGRREARYRRARSLHVRDLAQTRTLDLLWSVASLIRADRSAVVWLDEYGPGLAHPFVVLDLAAERPRRDFSPAPLSVAWETPVPGLLDLPRLNGHGDKYGAGVASSCIVSLGSDGPRSWFLVADSLTPRPGLSEETSGELMFLAGEITSLVLHRDLDLRRLPGSTGAAHTSASTSLPGRDRFPGWGLLKDLEGVSSGDPEASRIRARFLVARVVEGLLRDALVADPDTICRQVELVRGEIGASGGEDPEGAVWERVLLALTSRDTEELTASVLEWGKVVESAGQLHGARELFLLAFQLARVSGSSLQALDSARFLGKVFRTEADWEEALAWYGVAHGIAEDVGDPIKRAVVLDGLANTFRDRGNLPRARETLHTVLEIGRANGNRYITAIGHHDLMTVQKLSGDLVSAIRHGWRAVNSYDSREGSLRALFDLSGVLRETGELRAARDGYSVVADGVAGFEYRVLSLDALALIAALEGDEPVYRSIRERMEEVGWRRLSPVYQGQVLYYRGLSSRALGWEEEERKWLAEALSYAETHGLNKLIFDVEQALSGGWENIKPPAPSERMPEPFGDEISGVRSGLRQLRETSGAAAGPSS